MATREEILTLAERLAKHERFSPDWLTYPEWAGALEDARPYLEKAGKLKEYAKAILEGTIPSPAWLAEEDPAFRIPETPEQKITPPPPPAKPTDAAATLNKRAYPLTAAWILRAASPPRSPPQERPPSTHPPPQREGWQNTAPPLHKTKEALLLETSAL